MMCILMRRMKLIRTMATPIHVMMTPILMILKKRCQTIQMMMDIIDTVDMVDIMNMVNVIEVITIVMEDTKENDESYDIPGNRLGEFCIFGTRLSYKFITTFLFSESRGWLRYHTLTGFLKYIMRSKYVISTSPQYMFCAVRR